jgi:NADH dehydrogenase
MVVIDQHNYHLFQPLLYHVATAGLSPADIASPIPQILRGQPNTTVMLAKVSGVDLARKEAVAEERRIGFDRLMLATGARHAYFGHDEFEKYAPGLKRIDDATYLRRRILLAFEKAETETDAEERRRLLNFVVVGAGPTGVEMAGVLPNSPGRRSPPISGASIRRRRASFSSKPVRGRFRPSSRPCRPPQCGRSISSAWRRASAAL